MRIPEPEKLTPAQVRRLVRAGESEHVEFKGRVTSTEELVASVVCLANADGGIILYGVENDHTYGGIRHKDATSLLRTIFNSTSPSQRIRLKEVDVGGNRVVGIWVRPSPLLVSTTGGEYSVRVGIDCMPMTPDRLQVRMIDVGELDFSGAQTPIGVGVVDEVEIERYRRALPDDERGQELRRLPVPDLLRTVGALVPGDGDSDLLTVAGLLVFGEEGAIRHYVPHHELVFVRSQDDTTDYERRVISAAPVLALLDRITTEVAAGSRIRTLKLGAQDLEVPDYPNRVIREAITNALAHRHYRLAAGVSLRQTAGALELESPGGFPEGVTPDTVIQHAPVHRNKLLCDILERVRYMERSGLGVDRIFEDQLRYGKAPPEYIADKSYVRLRLDSSTYDEPFARFVFAQERRGWVWSVAVLLILSYLRRMGPADRQTLASVTQTSEIEVQEVLNRLLGDLVDRFGSGHSIRYALSARVQAALGAEAAYTRERGLAREAQRGIVMEHARRFRSIDNATVRQILGISRTEATVLLLSLRQRGDLVQRGERRWATWIPADD